MRKVMDQDTFLRYYELVYCLHPCIEVADAVLFEAVGFFPNSITKQRRLPATFSPNNARLTERQLLQRTLLETSLIWEIDQEQGIGTKTPRYHPDAKVMLVRFIEYLALRTLFRADSYPTAIALGSCLYTYEPYQACEIVSLPRHGPRYEHRRRFKSDMLAALTTRFQHALVTGGSRGMATEPPSDVQRQLVQATMYAFTPWDTRCLPADNTRTRGELLSGQVSEWTHKHAMFCLACAGWERLAQEWALDEQRHHPQHKLRIPLFQEPFPPSGPNSTHLDDDPPLSEDELQDRLRQAQEILRTYGQRRVESRFTHLQVYVDGIAQGQFRLDEPTFDLPAVSSYASSLAVYGVDTSGQVPLALFDLPDATEEGQDDLHMTAVLESGATLTLTGALQRTADDIVSWSLILRWEPETVVRESLAWCDACLSAITRSLALSRLLGHEAFGKELEAAMMPRFEEIAHVVRRIPDNPAWSADLLTRLGDLYRTWKHEAQAEACWQASDALRRESQRAAPPPSHIADLRERLVRWVSALWQPLWAGEPVTAADIPTQEQVFAFDEGEIRLTCEWRATYQHQPALLRLTWQANLPLPTDIWVRFAQPDDPMVVLTEVQLGQALAGEAVWTAPELGFDPTREPWALIIVLRDPAA